MLKIFLQAVKTFYTWCFYLGITLALLILAVACILSCRGLECTLNEICCHFMAVYLIGVIVLSVLIALDCFIFKRFLKAAMANLLVCLFIVGFVAIKMVPLWISVDTAPPASNLAVLHLNLFGYFNHDYKTVFEQIDREQPDIVVVSELCGKWQDKLDKQLAKTYPYRDNLAADGGLGLYSKHPLKMVQLRRIKYVDRSRIFARVEHPVLGPITVLLVHPVTPLGPPEHFAARNEELEIYARELKAYRDPAILVGDLNCTPWSPYFDRLLKAGDLKDSERGFGFMPSWPCMYIFPVLPIDHLLVSQNISVKQRRMLAPAGSDHLPLLVRLYVGGR